MDAQRGSARDVGQLRASGRREATTAAAARVLSIDYRPIVEEAVARLAENTPDKRCEVYTHARGVVKRHLQLLRLPEPIIELEKLALEITLRKVERGWRAREPTANVPRRIPAGRIRNTGKRPPASFAKAHFAKAHTARGRTIGVAVALPIIAAMIFFGVYADDKATYRALVDGPVGRWFSGINAEPGATTPTPASADLVTPDRRPTRVGPVRAVFAVPADARAETTRPETRRPETTGPPACGSGGASSERNACTHDAGAANAKASALKSDTEPLWLESFAVFSDVTSGRAPSTTPAVPSMTAGDMPTRGIASPPTPEPREATPVAIPSEAAAVAVSSPTAPTPTAKPVNAKVTTLLESGKRAILKGDVDRAVRDFSEAIRIDPKYPDSYSERGQALFKLGEAERAIADYSAALAREPLRSATLRARGMAYLYTGKTDLALADLSKAIELGERDPGQLPPIELFYARRSRGAIYDSKQEYDREIADCTALIESYTHDPTLVEALTANYGNAGAANTVATIYRQRANAFIKKSNWERAVADLTEAIPLSSDRGYVALIDRAKLQEGLGRYKLAAADAQAALNIRPGSEEARLALSRLAASSKQTPANGL